MTMEPVFRIAGLLPLCGSERSTTALETVSCCYRMIVNLTQGKEELNLV